MDAYRIDYSPVPRVEIEKTEVDIAPLDIKPGSCPNALNLNANGVLAPAILGTAGFDICRVSPDSVRLQGVVPLRWAWEDVSWAPDARSLNLTTRVMRPRQRGAIQVGTAPRHGQRRHLRPPAAGQGR